jgi:hypothetical protein
MAPQKSEKSLDSLIKIWSAGIIFLMTLFPPWIWKTWKQGFHFILSDLRLNTNNVQRCQIDFKQLILQYIVVVIGAFLLMLIVDKSKNRTN